MFHFLLTAAKKKAPAPPPRSLPVTSPVQEVVEELNDTDNAPPPAYISGLLCTQPPKNICSNSIIIIF